VTSMVPRSATHSLPRARGEPGNRAANRVIPLLGSILRFRQFRGANQTWKIAGYAMRTSSSGSETVLREARHRNLSRGSIETVSVSRYRSMSSRIIADESAVRSFDDGCTLIPRANRIDPLPKGCFLKLRETSQAFGTEYCDEHD